MRAPRILVVDDQPESVQFFALLLPLYLPGAEILSAGQGARGLALARERRPDLIVLDVKMPDLDGYQVCERLKADPVTADIPVLMVSGVLIGAKNRVRGFETGADGYLCKPFEPLEFVAHVKSLLRMKRAADDLHQTVAAQNGSLRESEGKFRTLFDGSPDAVFVADAAGCILDANPAACALHERTREQLAGSNVFELIPEEHREAARREFAGWFEGAAGSFEGFSLAAGQRHIPVQIRGRRIQLEGRPAVILQVRDMTEHRKLEEQLRQVQKIDALGRMAGGIAHDFNNLLTSILGFGNILLRQLGPGHAAAGEVREIISAGEKGADLIRHLLAFSRKQTLDKQPVDLNLVILDMERLLRRTLGEDVELVSELASQLEIVMADPIQISQVIMNLAINARDAMPGGGRLVLRTGNTVLDESARRQSIEARPGRYVCLTVQDTGCGISDEIRNSLFEPFVTSKEKGKGTGLGLATVYGIVKQCGGHIGLDTAPGRGTEFRIFLPAAAQPAGSPAARKEGEMPRGTETVLLAEDEDKVRELTARVLRSLGYQVLPAAHGAEALERYGQYPGTLHLVITDVVMPHMGGVALISHLRHLRRDFRVLYITGFSDHMAVKEQLAHEEAELLKKPFLPAGLATRVREVLDRPAAPPAA